uniref:hypothetical protein n=1 Tax=Microbulbifer agarilyticus TaxID=260552 RepID=UPI000255BB0E|nr:hypothetical protein [Microbulbifer agarilyticus]
MKIINLAVLGIVLASVLSLVGCANETTYANRPLLEPDQTIKPIYGQPTVFSEGDNLVALAVDENTYRARDNVVFLRLWVYNGTSNAFALGHAHVTASAEPQGELTPQATAAAQVPSLSQQGFNRWRKEHTRRKILSINEYRKGSVVTSPYLASHGMEVIKEQHNDASIGLPFALGFDEIARDATGQGKLIDTNPFSRLVREITYRRTTPKHRHIFSAQELSPGEIQGGFIALDVAALPADSKRHIVVEVQAGNETHQFVIEQSSLTDPAT